ncbi:MAG: DUF3806 domain-containing protein [Limisphaerales bacterium]
MGLTTKFILTILVMGTLGFFGCSKQEAGRPPQPKFSELSGDDAVRLERQRGIVAAAAKKRYGTPSLAKTKADISVLQRLLDDKAFAKSQTYELQCLGVALGDILATELPLRWVMVTDEYGTDPTLRFKDSTIQVNVLTMISKRVERDEAVDIADLVRQSGVSVAQMEREFQR